MVSLIFLPAAWLADRYARRTVIALGLFVWSAMTCLGAAAQGFGPLFLTRMGVGIGAYTAGFFHVITHAFFKALLFLGAGSVIHGMHDEQDMHKMGGLWKKMPWTAYTMLVGCLAISGAGGGAVVECDEDDNAEGIADVDCDILG